MVARVLNFQRIDLQSAKILQYGDWVLPELVVGDDEGPDFSFFRLDLLDQSFFLCLLFFKSVSLEFGARENVVEQVFFLA